MIGSGAVAQRLGALLRDAGNEVTLGSRDPGTRRAEVVEAFAVSDVASAAAVADVIVLAVPYSAVEDLRPERLEPTSGKIVVDATNPIGPDWSPLDLGHADSAAARIQELLPRAHVVKAFNTVFADRMAPGKLAIGGVPLTVFVAGDHEPSVAEVTELVDSVGFSAQRAGGLGTARYLEGLAHLNIAMALAGGGTEVGFAFLRQSAVSASASRSSPAAP